VFVDRAIIHVQAGKGGDGCLSFYRGKGLPKGGPDGGDGGKGGDVVFETDSGVNTLYDFRGRRHWHAKNGEPGRGKSQFGAAADDLVIRVPEGTLIFDNETGELLADLGPGDRRVIARGGVGGRGNERFKSATNQVPQQVEAGEPGEAFEARLDLKLIADVGFLGKPNAGKSTLLKALTHADPKIAAYPFTTLGPQLGIAELDPARRLVLADIPGLIEGASDGAGLGHDFLRHVERTRVLLHLLDVAPADGATPADNYRAIREELFRYAPALAEKPELIALNKNDLLLDDRERDEAVAKLRDTLQLDPKTEGLCISGGARSGLDTLLERLWSVVHPDDGGVTPGWRDAANDR